MLKVATHYLYLSLVLLLSGLVVGQADTPTIDPASFFVDGVQYEQIAIEPDDQALYHLNYSQQTIRVRASTTSEWQVFPYPEDMPVIECATLRTDGLWLIQARCYGLDPQTASLYTVRLLDPLTGIYTMPETICDGQLKASTGEGEWVYWLAPDNRQTRLCFTETGELHGHLPDEIRWNSHYPLKFSPDKEYLVLQGYDAQDDDPIHFYSYKLADDQIISLGTVALASAGLIQWLDATRGVISGSDGYEQSGFDLYYFDVTRPESLEFAMTAFETKAHTLYFDEAAQRYESILTYWQITSETGSRGEFAPCTLFTLDAAGATSYMLGNHCVLLPDRGEDAGLDSYTNAYRVENRYYYLAAESEKSTLSRLMYFDLEDLKVYRAGRAAEIDSISSISPDGRYVILEFGEDKRLNNLQHCCTFERYGWAGVYDLEQGKIIYISDPATNIRSIWLDNTTVLIVSDSGFRAIQTEEEGDVFYIGVPGFRRIELHNGQGVIAFTSTFFPVDDFRLNDISADGHYMLSEYGVVDLTTFEFIPIIKPEITLDRFDLHWEEDTLMARIWDRGQEVFYRIIPG